MTNRASRPLILGIGILGLSLGVIYFRGYLVPGTPTITKRYFPDSVLRLFGKHQPIEPTNRSGIDPETVLRNANIIYPCEQNDDLCLTDDFREEWLSSIESMREIDPDRQQFASLLDINDEHISIRDAGGAYIVSVDDARFQQWESKAALLADLAAERELSERHSQWNDFGPKSRVQVLRGLRVFAEKCPICNGEISMDEETVESCCRSIEVIAVSCRGCGDRLLEVSS